jgi:hypothetical protein
MVYDPQSRASGGWTVANNAKRTKEEEEREANAAYNAAAASRQPTAPGDNIWKEDMRLKAGGGQDKGQQREWNRRDEAYGWADGETARRTLEQQQRQMQQAQLARAGQNAAANYAGSQTQIGWDKARVQGLQTPYMDRSQIANANSSYMQGMNTLAGQLQAQAQGQGPSLAQMQLSQATDRNLAALMSAQAAARGGPGGALAQRQLMSNMGNVQSQAGAASAQLRLQEQMAAQQQLAGVLGQGQQAVLAGRGQDIGMAAADQAQAAQTMALKENLFQKYTQMGMSIDQARAQVDMDIAQMAYGPQGLAGQYNQFEQQRTIAGMADDKDTWDKLGILGGPVASGAGAAGATIIRAIDPDSDENLKHDIKPVSATKPITAMPSPSFSDMDDDDAEFVQRMMASGSPQGGGLLMGILSPNNAGTPQGRLLQLNTNPKLKTAGGSGIGTSAGDVLKRNVAGFASHPTSMKSYVTSDTRLKDIPGQVSASEPFPSSDERSKSTSRSSDMTDELLNSIKAYTYRYKDKAKHGDGLRYGLMAQDLEKSETGRSMVKDMPHGKVVDGGQAALAALAATSELHKRQQALERALLKSSKKEKKS